MADIDQFSHLTVLMPWQAVPLEVSEAPGSENQQRHCLWLMTDAEIPASAASGAAAAMGRLPLLGVS